MRIFESDGARLDELEPLWHAMAGHHQDVAPHFGAARPLEDSWARRREQYEQWLADPDTYLLIAEPDGEQRAIGYALMRPLVASQSWDDGPRAILESLSVLPEFRGQGIGTRLLQAVRVEARARNVRRLVVEAVASNAKALDFYAREGFLAHYLTLVEELAP